MSAAVSLNQPIIGLCILDVAKLVSGLGIVWCCTGVTWAAGAKIAQESRRRWLLLPLLILAANGVSMSISISPIANHAAGGTGLARLPLFDLGVYNIWINLFYGGLYTLGYFATRRTLRLRRRLAELRISRDQAEARLREARVQAVRGQLQPNMLLDALDVLRRTYARNRHAGDALFDLLVAFLRAAMPGLRSGASTLAAELVIIDRYAVLREALETGPPAWRLTLAEPPPDLPFPPLRLLPALDRMSRTAPPGAAVEVTAEAGVHDFVVRIAVPAPQPLPIGVLQRLRSAMRQDLGVGASMTRKLTGGLVAELRVKPRDRTMSHLT